MDPLRLGDVWTRVRGALCIIGARWRAAWEDGVAGMELDAGRRVDGGEQGVETVELSGGTIKHVARELCGGYGVVLFELELLPVPVALVRQGNRHGTRGS